MIPYLDWGIYAYHSPEWWARLWSLSQCIKVEISDLLPNGFDVWFHWESIGQSTFNSGRDGDFMLLKADKGNYLTFGRTVGKKAIKRW